MPSEVLKQVAAMFDRLINIKTGNGACRTGCHVICPCQYDGGTIINFCQAGSYDTDHPFVPFFIVENDRTPFGQSFQIGDNVVGFFCHALVEVLAGFVVLVDLSCFLQCNREIFLREQVDRFFSILDTSRSIDARSDFEHDIADSDFPFGESADVNNCFHSHTRVTVQLFQSVKSKNTVLAHNRHDVRSDTYRYQIEQRNQVMKLDTVADSKCLHELETDTATRKVCVRIRIVRTFGV